MLREMNIGKRIRETRRAKGLSQADLARACGWKQQSRVSNYERGTREPDHADLRKIAAALGTSPAWLAYEEGVGSTIGGTSPVESEIERLVRSLPVPVTDRAGLLRLLTAWAALPPALREYVVRRADGLRRYSDQLSPIARLSMRALPHGPDLLRFEKALDEELTRQDQETVAPIRLSRSPRRRSQA